MNTFDAEKAKAQMGAVAELPVELELKTGELLVLIAALQLACRHPGWDGASRQVVEQVTRNWQDIAADPGSEMWRALQAGWDPKQDIDGASLRQPRQGKAERSQEPESREVARGNKARVRRMTRLLLATLNRWIGEHGPVDYTDVFMAAHNFHCAVVFDLEERNGETKGLLRKMAIDTMRERFDRQSFEHVKQTGE